MALPTPSNLEQFIKTHKITSPNGTTGVTHIRKDDIILLNGRPCKVTKTLISNVETRGRMQGIAEVEGRGVLDQSWQRQSFMLLDEVETGVGAFWWEPRVYSCLLIELLRGRIGNLRDVEDPNVIFKIDISDWETLKSLMGVYNDGRKSEAVFLRPRYRYRLIEAEANDLDLLAIRIWFLMGVYRILGLEDSEGGLVQS